MKTRIADMLNDIGEAKRMFFDKETPKMGQRLHINEFVT